MRLFFSYSIVNTGSECNELNISENIILAIVNTNKKDENQFEQETIQRNTNRC